MADLRQADQIVRDFVREYYTPGVLFTTRNVLDHLAEVGIDMSEPAGGWHGVDQAIRDWVVAGEETSRWGVPASLVVKVVDPSRSHPDDRVRYAWFPAHVLSYQGDARKAVRLRKANA
jgi:hypothetical protein